jgi:hypothetical protein
MSHKTERAMGAANSAPPSPSSLGAVIQFPAGPTDRSVGPRVASSKAKPLESRGLDTRSALHAISRARLPSAETRVLAFVASLAAKHGEAWPRVPTIAEAIGMHERNVRRALRALETRGFLAARLVDSGGALPNGQRVFGQPIRVFRVISTGMLGRAVGPDPGRIAQPDPGRAVAPGTPYDLIDPHEIHCDDDDIDPCDRSGAREVLAPGGSAPPLSPPPPEDERADARCRSRAADAAVLVTTSASSADASASSPAPDSQIVVASGEAGAAGARDRERMDERRASREALNEGGGAPPASSDPRDRRRAARRVLERHAELVAAIGLEVKGAVCTRSLLDLVESRLGDGFAEADLVALAAYAVTSEWHLQKPTRTSARFLFRSAEEVGAVLLDAAAAARKGGAKRAGGRGRGAVGTPGGTDVQRADPEPASTREQMVTGAAELVAALAKGGAR